MADGCVMRLKSKFLSDGFMRKCAGWHIKFSPSGCVDCRQCLYVRMIYNVRSMAYNNTADKARMEGFLLFEVGMKSRDQSRLEDKSRVESGGGRGKRSKLILD